MNVGYVIRHILTMEANSDQWEKCFILAALSQLATSAFGTFSEAGALKIPSPILEVLKWSQFY